MKKQPEPTNDTPLIPLSDFKEKLKQMLSVSKEESDRHMAEFQASNVKQRVETGQKKRGRKSKKAT